MNIQTAAESKRLDKDRESKLLVWTTIGSPKQLLLFVSQSKQELWNWKEYKLKKHERYQGIKTIIGSQAQVGVTLPKIVWNDQSRWMPKQTYQLITITTLAEISTRNVRYEPISLLMKFLHKFHNHQQRRKEFETHLAYVKSKLKTYANRISKCLGPF